MNDGESREGLIEFCLYQDTAASFVLDEIIGVEQTNFDQDRNEWRAAIVFRGGHREAVELSYDEAVRSVAMARGAPDRAPEGGLFVVFDGPPGHESGRFIEVEDAEGKGLREPSGAEWKQCEDGYWMLGPFFRAPTDHTGEGRCGCDHAPCRHDAYRILKERDDARNQIAELERESRKLRAELAKLKTNAAIDCTMGPSPYVLLLSICESLVMTPPESRGTGVHFERLVEFLNAERAAAEDDLDKVAQSLIDEANARGGEDNITVALIRCDKA